MIKILCFISCCLFLQNNYAQNWDIDLLKNINPTHPDSKVWRTFSSAAEPISVAIPVGLFAVAIFNKDTHLKSQSIEMLGTVAVAAVATEAFKIIINRQRPYQKYPLDIFPDDASENGHSFPSAHTSLSFATATSLALIYKKWYVTVPAFVWAGCVGYSRMYLGQHYPTDILGGAVVGAGGAFASHWLNKKLFGKKKNQSLPSQK